jgi:putative nucleotidyltransferase with HDIG domain
MPNILWSEPPAPSEAGESEAGEAVRVKKKVLFVDDEPNVLAGLRRMLRPMQSEWSCGFADGGPQALAALDREPFDIIVSDMRMPGMTGAQLLEGVRQKFPPMVRILLTGQCDQASGLRAVRVAHQMLYKPCDMESLKAVVARTCALSDVLPNQSLQAMVARQESIPSVPELYGKVLQEMDAPAPSLERIAALVSHDIGMSAKILHVVNSSFFGLRREIRCPRQAVALLGLETLRLLILAVGIFSRADAVGTAPFSLTALQEHSSAVSTLAGAIAKAENADPREIEYAAIAGLLHDVGKLVLLAGWPEQYPRIAEQAAHAGCPLWAIEQETFGASHAKIGACLLTLWGLPMSITEAIAWHHQPADCSLPSFGTLTAVHVANALVSNGPAGMEKIDRAYLQRLNILDRLPIWLRLARTPRGKQGAAVVPSIPQGTEHDNLRTPG